MCRVQIRALHFTNCEVNSSYCNHKVVNHTTNANQVFYQLNINSSALYFSTLYLHFVHPLHTIIKRNIVYT